MSKKFDYTAFREYKLHEIMRPFGSFLNKAVFHVSYEGQENIPQDGKAFIVCPNHISAADPVYVALGMKPRCHFMAKEELFKNPAVAWALEHNNSFPVKRGKIDVASVKYAINLIKHNKNVAIFPEGTRSKDGKPKQGKNGAAYVAKKTGADVLPVAICKDDAKKRIVVRYGSVIKNSDFGFTESRNKAELTDATNRIMGEVVSMWEEETCK